VNRTDIGSKDLIAYAQSIGFGYEHLGGSVDGWLWYGRQSVIVDWKKVKGGTLTEGQAKLIARGAPLYCISTPEQLDQLRAELKD
jgi:hypothetical protein